MSIAEDVEKLIEPAVDAENMELVDVLFILEHGKKVLRVFLDKPEGFNLSDCEKMSGILGDIIDASPLFPESYVLEISSPGIDRVIKKEKDFKRYAGTRIRVTVFAPIEGQRNFTGTILDAGDGFVAIDDLSGKKVTIPIAGIAKARMDPEININH